MNLLRNKKLHIYIEDALKLLINDVFTNYDVFKEIQGLAGGRNRLLIDYRWNKILFEIFASSSQVERDLLIFNKTDASVKIAIIIDKEIDLKVFNKFIKQNHLFFDDLINDGKIGQCVSKPLSIIEKDYYYHTLLLLLQEYSRPEIDKYFITSDVDFRITKN